MNLMHDPIPRERKIKALAGIMADLPTAHKRGEMAKRLEKYHGRAAAQEIVDEARTILRDRKQRGRKK